MMLKTAFHCDIPEETLAYYFRVLVGKVFKVLPMAEENKDSAKIYLTGLRFELRGVKRLFKILRDDPAFVSLLGIITELTQNIEEEEYTVEVIKREVFQAISICQKLEQQIISGGLSGGDLDE